MPVFSKREMVVDCSVAVSWMISGFLSHPFGIAGAGLLAGSFVAAGFLLLALFGGGEGADGAGG